MFNIVILRIKNQTQVHTTRCVKTRTGICNLWGGLTFSVGEKKFSNFCKTCISIRIWTNELMLTQNVFLNAPRQFSYHRTAYPRPQTNHTVSSILYQHCASHFTPRGCRQGDKCSNAIKSVIVQNLCHGVPSAGGTQGACTAQTQPHNCRDAPLILSGRLRAESSCSGTHIQLIDLASNHILIINKQMIGRAAGSIMTRLYVIYVS